MAKSQDGPYVENPNGAASAWFQANGDTFWVGDWKADGHSASAIWAVNQPCGWGAPPCPNTARNAKGANTGVPIKYDLKEGMPLMYRACTTEGYTPVSCSGIRNAWS
ncbi:hypothetical protein [Streptomyces sp. NPDC001880]